MTRQFLLKSPNSKFHEQFVISVETDVSDGQTETAILVDVFRRDVKGPKKDINDLS